MQLARKHNGSRRAGIQREETQSFVFEIVGDYLLATEDFDLEVSRVVHRGKFHDAHDDLIEEGGLTLKAVDN